MKVRIWRVGKQDIFLGCLCVMFVLSFLLKSDKTSGRGSKEKDKSKKYILLYTPFVKEDDWFVDPESVFNSCPMTDCILTSNRNLLESVSEYDALAFHDRNVCYTKLPDKASRKPDQIYIFAVNESPQNYRLDLRQEKFKSYFNWSMTHRTDSEIHFPYGFLVQTNDNAVDESFLANKEHLIAWVISNFDNTTKRTGIVKEIKQYVNISQFGDCNGRPIKDGDYTELGRKHKFYLAFENSICNDYVTEKFWRSLEFGMVPVVLDGAHHERVAPNHSYIKAEDFNSLKELVDYLKWLDNNDKEYMKYFEWRKSYKISRDSFEKAFCDICRKLHDPVPRNYIYQDIGSWYEEDQCEIPPGKKNFCPANEFDVPRDINDRKYFGTVDAERAYVG